MKKILAVCAHPDDEVLGCGGTLLKHLEEKDEINILFVFEGSSARYNNNKDPKLLSDIKRRENSAIKVSKILKTKSTIFLRNQNLVSNKNTILSITKKIIRILNKIKPNMIYTHSSKDLNVDHRICNEAVLVASRPQKNFILENLITFEIPSSTEWSLNAFGTFTPNYFVDISKFMKTKLKMLQLYDYELRPFPHPRSKENIIAQSKLSGSICGFKHSEKHEILKILKK